MNLFRSDSRIIFNVIFALILGIILGNFLGNTILSNQAINVNAGPYDDEVFIIQTGFYNDETNATIALNRVKDIGLNGLVVKEHNKYYVYLGIAYRSNQLDSIVSELDKNEMDYFIKAVDLYSLLEGMETNTQEYYFYFQSIKHYISLIHNKDVTFSEQYLDSIAEPNLPVYNSVVNLKQNLGRELAPHYMLEVYKNLVDALL